MPGNNKILFICDDNELSRYLIEKLMVDGGYFVSIEPTAQKGLASFKENGFDIIITRAKLPDSNPLDLVRELKAADPDCVIIALLDEYKQEVVEYLFSLGVYDVIAKPINLDKLFFLVRKGIDMHTLMSVNRRLSQGLKESNLALEKQNSLLAKRIEDSTKNLTRLYEDLRSTYMRTIKVLAQAIDARDHYTHSHSENVARIAVIIASEMGLSAKDVETIRQACELHDLGKIGVEDCILGKTSALTDEEWKQIRRHPQIAVQILEPLTFLNEVIELVRQHHEHYNGTGYPVGGKGDDIPIGARIIHLADAYEAMRSARSYRKIPLTKEAAIEEITKNSGTQFDPKVVEAFLRIVDRL
ncbi:MAG: HD domain-containing protein [Candidatus Omnitrophica bacterium]|jgi:putative nucleotidyltransferase with HDIG domain|nr:HD domain-containing protein [Candidatus Omnitrophota bacterium]